MNKVLKSIWVRALSTILCTVSILGLGVSILAVVLYSEMGGLEHMYRNIYGDIADGYALYAMEQVEEGEAAELEKYLMERGIACRITKQLIDENHEEISGTQEIAFSCGEVEKENLHQIEVLEGAHYEYNINSLVAAIEGQNYYSRYGDTISAVVTGIVFDEITGLFYYETDTKYFIVEDIVVYYEGIYMDYSFTRVDGEACYYNGYYKEKLDTTQYEGWDCVRIDGQRLALAPEKGYINTIYITHTSDILSKGVGKNVVYASIDEIDYYPEDYISTYMIQISWDQELAKEISVFKEWDWLYNDIVQRERLVLPGLVISFFLLIVSLVLLVISLTSEKEKMGLLHKVPVVIYSGCIFFIEVLLAMILLEGIPEVLTHYGTGSVDVGIVLVFMTTSVMVWLAVIWLQNILTRFRCKHFWRTTELYYIGRICKTVLEPIRFNIPLLVGGLVVFGVITIIELMIVMAYRWSGDGLTFFFLFIKAIEAIILFIVLFHMKELHEGGKRVAFGDMSKPIDTSRMFWKFKEHGENINKVSDGIALAVEERMKSERFKTELITNVSHDIKTPLTSIINYVDLIKKEEVQDEKLQEYVDVLDRQSARLKKLIEDLMEASKASTGNLAVNLEECDVEVLLTQIIGEFEERLEKNQLEVVVDKPDHPVVMMADGRHIWRVIDNLLNNACKYSLPGTRVYISLKQEKQEVVIVFKNISKVALNIPSDELMERFVRGDSSRNTEGSGLGLSIAQSLTELMRGSMKLEIDGDLFKVTLRFPTI